MSTSAPPSWSLANHLAASKVTSSSGPSNSTSIHDRFRRAIVTDDLVNAKRLFAHAVTLSTLAASHPTPYNYHHPESPSTLLPGAESTKPYPQYTPASLRAAQTLYAASHGEPFDVRNISLEAPLGDERRQSSLILAVEKGASIELIEWLLDMGHDTNEPSKDSDNNTVIAAAAFHCRADVIQLYCSNPNLDVPSLLDYSNNSEGKTALHLASLKGHVEVVRLLLDLGADIDLPDRQGNTPLHYAASWGHLTVVQLLIERGCSFAAVNAAGFTAADFSFTHSVKAAVEAFGRAQYEGRKRARKAERSAVAAAQSSAVGSSPRASANGTSPQGTPSRAPLTLQNQPFPISGMTPSKAAAYSRSNADYAGSESSYAGSMSGAGVIEGQGTDWSTHLHTQSLVSSPRSRGGSETRSPSDSASGLYTTDGRSTYRVVLPHTSPLLSVARPPPVANAPTTSSTVNSGLGSVASRMRMKDRMAMNEYMRHRARAAPTSSATSSVHPSPHLSPMPPPPILPAQHSHPLPALAGSTTASAHVPLLQPYSTSTAHPRSPSPSRSPLSTFLPTPPPQSPSATRSSASQSPDVNASTGGSCAGAVTADATVTWSPRPTNHTRVQSAGPTLSSPRSDEQAALGPEEVATSLASTSPEDHIVMPSSSTSANTLVPNSASMSAWRDLDAGEEGEEMDAGPDESAIRDR